MRLDRSVEVSAAAVLIYGLLSFSNHIGVSSQEDKYEGDSCKSLNDLPGTCQVDKDCPWIVQNVIQKRLVHIKNVPRCGFRFNDPLFCCPAESSSESSIESTTESATESATEYSTELRSSQLRKADQACQNFERPSTYIAQHIIEGKEADEGEIPFIAALGYTPQEPGKEYDFRCGSSWIAKNFLLTAAHCIRKKDDRPIVARIGTLNLTDSTDPNIQDSKLKDFHLHPDYRPRSKYHDIGLIELETPFRYADNVNKICLYTDPQDMVPDHVLTASGWGLTDTDATRSAILLKVDLNTEPLDRCAKHYQDQVGNFGGKLATGLTERQYCAIGKLELSGNRGDACGGDSGGPLHFKNDTVERFYLVGVTSFGLGCGASAGIYSRVASYLDWIEPIVWPDAASLLDD